MSGLRSISFIEVAGEKYAVMHTLPGSRLTKEQLLAKYYPCDTMINNKKTGEILLCIKTIDVEVGEIIKYEDSPGHSPEGGGEVQNADAERRKEISPPNNDGERTSEGEADNLQHEIRDSESV